MHYRKHARLLGLMLALAVLTVLPATARDKNINLAPSTSFVQRLDRPIHDVIAGDMGIADVSVQGERMLVVTGKKAGKTNVIVLDADSKEIFNALIIVSDAGPGELVEVYSTKDVLHAHSTYKCPPQEPCVNLTEPELVLPTQVTKQSIDQKIDTNQGPLINNENSVNPNPK